MPLRIYLTGRVLVEESGSGLDSLLGPDKVVVRTFKPYFDKLPVGVTEISANSGCTIQDTSA